MYFAFQIIRALVVLLLGAVLLPGCSGRDPLPAWAGSASMDAGSNSSQTSSSCESWSTRECGIELGTHDNAVSCARGTQICENGTWGTCMPDATKGITSVPLPKPRRSFSDGLTIQSVGGDSTVCEDNPCDPYCNNFNDTPDAAYEAPVTNTPTGWMSGGTLAASNVPSAFKTKGSLDSQCSAAVGSDTYNEACQFDQHCVSGACTAFETKESGSCTGIDITAPTTCIPSTGYRDVTVCNRGTQSAPAGIKCYLYSGGSPQYPNDSPGTTGHTLIMTTATVLSPGTCETQTIADSLFGQSGIQSLMCNPPETSTASASVGPNYPTTNASVSGYDTWTNPSNGYASDTVYTTVTPPDPNGATTAKYPTSDTTYSTDGSWSSRSNAYSASDSDASATAAPLLPSSNSGTVNATPTTTTNPGVSGDNSFTNPGNALASDGSYATVSLSNPSTQTVLTSFPTANNGSTAWQNVTNAYASDGVYTTSTLTAAGTNSVMYSGFGFNNLPTNAVLDSLVLTVKWKATVNSNKYLLALQAMTGTSYTTIGTELKTGSTLTTETTDTITVSAATLASFALTDFNDTNFKVRLRFTRYTGSVANATASVDYVKASLTYHLSSSVASMAVGNFGITTVPAGSTISATAEVKWKTSAVNANAVFSMQPYKEWGTTSQATMGSGVTRTPAAANTDYVDTATFSPSAADLSDSRFKVLLKVTRSAGSTTDFTASVDYVKVSLTWTLSGTSVTRSIVLKGFGFDNVIPSTATISSITTEARWKLSATTTHSTLGVQAFNSGTALGTETTTTTAPTTFTTATQTVSTGLTRTMVNDANLSVRVRVTRDLDTSTSNPDFTASLDYVKVTVAWKASGATYIVSYGGFGFNAIPTDATITEIKTETAWKTDVANTHATLGIQAYVGAGATALGSETTATPSTSLLTATQDVTGLSLSSTDVTDGNLFVRLKATRSDGTGNGGNPNFTASVDYVRVTVKYEYPVQVSVVECNGSNNWSATKLVPDPDKCSDMTTPDYTPFTVTRVFQATCPNGTLPEWQDFGYTSSTPDGTSIQFRFQGFDANADGTCPTQTSITSGTAAATASLTQDPEVCSLTDTSGTCPIDLTTRVGYPTVGYECLQMDAYGIPTSSETPQLINWTLNYDCAPNQ